MKIRNLISCALCGLTLFACSPSGGGKDREMDRFITDLMDRMTLREKLGQLNLPSGGDLVTGSVMNGELSDMIRKQEIGGFFNVKGIQKINALQHLAVEESRLKIPLLVGADVIHGYETIFPIPLALSCSWDTLAVERMARISAIEASADGINWTFSPMVDICRDARWGRVGETFGEDPFLVGQMGAATVRGLQTSDVTGQDKVLACTKHFIGGSQPVNGINGAPCDISDRTLHEVFMPPFKDCLDAGTYTFMMAHNELNGVPCHTSKYLMKDILRDAWKFNGFIVSDWMDIEQVHEKHCTAATLKDAYLQSVKNGMDMHMHGPEFADAVIELVNEKELPMSRVDDAVSKICLLYTSPSPRDCS